MNTSAHSPLPCPFCRGSASVNSWSRGIGLDNVRGFFVSCNAPDCGMSGERVIEGAGRAEAIRSWNRIVSSVNAHASLVERVKELEKALRETVDALKDVVNAAGNDQPYSPKELGELFAGIASGSEDVLARGGP